MGMEPSDSHATIPGMGATELYFHGWPEMTFLAWVAGYFDGEGCVHIRAWNRGVELSIVNTDPNTLHSIRERFGFGALRVLREPTDRHRKQYVWKVVKLADVRSFLIRVRPYLTTKAQKADLAIAYICKSVERQQAQQEQDARVRELRASGLTQREIAERIGTSRTNVSQTLSREPAARSLL